MSVLIGSLVAVALLAVIVAAMIAAWVGGEAEKTLHAYLLVLDVLQEYVETEGEWPNGWSDIKTVRQPGTNTFWRWPEDSDEIANRITIEFDLRGKNLAGMTADSFDLVRQSQPNYGPYAYGEIERLLELLRAANIEQEHEKGEQPNGVRERAEEGKEGERGRTRHNSSLSLLPELAAESG